MKYKLKENSGTYMYKKKALNTHYEYKSTVHLHVKV